MNWTPPPNALAPLPPDEGDKKYELGSLISYPKLNELPRSYELDEVFAVKDQVGAREDDYCTAYSFCAASEYQEEVELLPRYSFAASKRISGNVNGWGQDLRSAAKAHVQYGALAVRDAKPQDLALSPQESRDWKNYTVESVSAAKKHYKQAYFNTKGPYDAYDNIRAALWMFRNEKRAVVIGVKWGWPLSEYRLTGTPDGYGHAVCITGWDDDGLIVKNSAGIHAGKNGFHRLSRETAEEYVRFYGGFMFLDETPESLQKRFLDEISAMQLLINFLLNVYGLIKKTVGGIFGSLYK